MKTALVIGGSSGLGRAIAEASANKGATVVAAGRRYKGAFDSGKWLVAGIQDVHLDVTDETGLETLASGVSELDLLVYAAGNAQFRPLAEETATGMREHFEIHVVGLMRAAKAFFPALAKRRGCVLVTGSIAATEAFSGSTAYAAAKAAQRKCCEVIREEWRSDVVRVIDATLGAIDTPIWDGLGDFDRTKMLDAASLASRLVDLADAGGLGIESVRILPHCGKL